MRPDIAKELFEHIVENPELDSTWAAFHVEEDAAVSGTTQISRAEDEGMQSDAE